MLDFKAIISDVLISHDNDQKVVAEHVLKKLDVSFNYNKFWLNSILIYKLKKFKGNNYDTRWKSGKRS